MPLKILTPLSYLSLSPLSFSCLCPFLSSFSFLGPFYFSFLSSGLLKKVSNTVGKIQKDVMGRKMCGFIQAKVHLFFSFSFSSFLLVLYRKKQCLHHINKSRSDFHSYSLFSSLGKILSFVFKDTPPCSETRNLVS